MWQFISDMFQAEVCQAVSSVSDSTSEFTNVKLWEYELLLYWNPVFCIGEKPEVIEITISTPGKTQNIMQNILYNGHHY